jgi:ATP-grasp domain-containing protein/L-aminoacid ligase-like protein
MSRVLLLATTTGYQTRSFGDAAERLGVDLVLATDRCHVIDDPWGDGAIPIRFHEEEASVAAIVAEARTRAMDGILAVGDRPSSIAAAVAAALGLRWHSREAASNARNKISTRERLREAGLPVPWVRTFDLEVDDVPRPVSYPCVLKPAALSGSRGVMRADDAPSLAACVTRLQALMRSPDVRAERDDVHLQAVLEGYIPGHEYAVEGLMHRGTLHVLAIFDKPDPLDGPFFEETIYITPAVLASSAETAIVDAVRRAAEALGLSHGPIHAECRVSPDGVHVLEVAARPIGGLCARALRFERWPHHEIGTNVPPAPARGGQTRVISLEELLLRHALGERPDEWRREDAASGVMMVPIPRRGVYRGVAGTDDALRVEHVEDVRITAKMDQLLLPLPEGASYLGFVFARAPRYGEVNVALRAAHAQLRFAIDPELALRVHA